MTWNQSELALTYPLLMAVVQCVCPRSCLPIQPALLPLARLIGSRGYSRGHFDFFFLLSSHVLLFQSGFRKTFFPRVRLSYTFQGKFWLCVVKSWESTTPLERMSCFPHERKTNWLIKFTKAGHHKILIHVLYVYIMHMKYLPLTQNYLVWTLGMNK